MNEREAFELLSVLETTTATPRDVRSRIWSRVDAQLSDVDARERSVDADRLLVVVATEQDSGRASRKWARVAVIAAACALAVAGFVRLDRTGPSIENVSTESAATASSAPILTDPNQACERLRTAPIRHDIYLDPTTEPANATQLGRVETAFSTLVRDFEAADEIDPALFGSGDRTSLDGIIDRLRQARLQLEQGDANGSEATLRTVSPLVELLTSPVDDVEPCLGAS